MKQLFTALILAGGLAAAQANAACDYPVAPGKFPDGNQATKDEMLAAKPRSGSTTRTWTPTSTASRASTTRRSPPRPTRRRSRRRRWQRMQDQKHNAAVEEVDRRDRSLQRAAARVKAKIRRRRSPTDAAGAADAPDDEVWRVFQGNHVAADARPGRNPDRAAPRVPADRVVAADAGRGRGAAREHLRRARPAAVRSRGHGWHRDRPPRPRPSNAGRLRVAGIAGRGRSAADARRIRTPASRS